MNEKQAGLTSLASRAKNMSLVLGEKNVTSTLACIIGKREDMSEGKWKPRQKQKK
jgi:hypothetical protein